MHDVMTVFSKEIKRFWIDKKLLFTSVLLPGVMIFIIYSIMGSVFSAQALETQTRKSTVYVEHLPEVFLTLLDETLFELIPYQNQDIETLIDEEQGAVLIFDENFLTSLETEEFPTVELYYRSTNELSSIAGSRVSAVLNAFRNAILSEQYSEQERLVFNQELTIFQDESDIFVTVVSGIVPLLIIIFLFAGALSIGPDVIAGEKERGTLATLLVTPVSRGAFAMGKILAISAISLASAFSSFLGIALSLPRLLQIDESSAGVNILDIYGIDSFIALLLVILVTTLFIVGLISVVSAYAKSVKEAASLASPLYLITIVISALNIFSDGSQNLIFYAIPLYGPIQVINGIMTQSLNWLEVIIVLLSNIMWTLVLAVVVRKMLSSERIVFQK